MVYIVIGGTVIPFSMYLMGLTAVGPTKASLISCMEPMASIVLVVLVLGTPLTLLGPHGDGLHNRHGFVIISTEEVINFWQA
jgi:drug/metabolite transporter (DMT)-like permease